MSTVTRRRALSGLGNTALTLASILGVICIAFVLLGMFFHITLIMFKTGSMSPTIPTGSLAIVREIPAAEAKVGDIVTVDRGGDQLPITHRVVSTAGLDNGFTSLTLKGDANATPDAAPYAVNTVRLVIFAIPGLAYVVAGFSSPIAIGGITVLVTALVTWAFWPSERRSERSPDDSPRRARPSGRRVAHTTRTHRRSNLDKREGRHAFGHAASLVGVIAGMSLAATVVPVSSAHAATIEETITSNVLTLVSIRDPEAMVNMLPGQPVSWQIGISAHPTEPGNIALTLLSQGTLVTDETGLWLDVSSCTVRWVNGTCSTGGHVVSGSRPASSFGGESFDLGTMPSTEQRWLLIRAYLPSDPQLAGKGYAELSIRATGGGDSVSAGFGGKYTASTGFDPRLPLTAALFAIGLGLLLAFSARFLRRRLA